MSAEGVESERASADFERCRELAAEPTGDEMFSTLISLWAIYLARGELTRSRELSATLRAWLGGREAFAASNLASFGMLDWFEGHFGAALAALETADREQPDENAVAAAWYIPNDHAAAIQTHLALARFVAGDRDGAEKSLGRAIARAARLEFPQGPWSTAYANWLGSWMWFEAGEHERAAAAIAHVGELSARHGFDSWELIVATHTAVLEGEAEGAAALTDIWSAVGLRALLPFYLTRAGALLAAAGDDTGARERYEQSLALAAETGMHFYDAETLRLLGRRDEALALARAQGARVFERRILA
jgi:tetratricopeptide (TPR) repeat protein